MNIFNKIKSFFKDINIINNNNNNNIQKNLNNDYIFYLESGLFYNLFKIYNDDIEKGLKKNEIFF
jgi:hypothetical protein